MHNAGKVSIEPVPGNGPVNLIINAAQALVQPRAVLVIATQEPVLRTPPFIGQISELDWRSTLTSPRTGYVG